MGKDIREVHYEAWVRKNKFVDIDILELEDGTWKSTCREKFDFCEIRETKRSAYNMMEIRLHREGYKIGNSVDIFLP